MFLLPMSNRISQDYKCQILNKMIHQNKPTNDIEHLPQTDSTKSIITKLSTEQ